MVKFSLYIGLRGSYEVIVACPSLTGSVGQFNIFKGVLDCSFF